MAHVGWIEWPMLGDSVRRVYRQEREWKSLRIKKTNIKKTGEGLDQGFYSTGGRFLFQGWVVQFWPQTTFSLVYFLQYQAFTTFVSIICCLFVGLFLPRLTEDKTQRIQWSVICDKMINVSFNVLRFNNPLPKMGKKLLFTLSTRFCFSSCLFSS